MGGYCLLSKACKDTILELAQENVLFDEPMCRHTSFRIGGPADAFIEPSSPEVFADLVRFFRRESVPYFVIGAGSNLLVADRGIRGVVIKTGKGLDGIDCDGNIITAGSGVQLAKLAAVAAQHSLSGLEFASGIPGLVGGAVFMNAGAYGGEMKDVVMRTKYLDETGEVQEISGAAHNFVYRGSAFSEGGKYILSTQVQLASKPEEEIRAVMKELNGRRKEKQPLEFPSAGSTFKRPEGYFAAKLIEDAGLKGAAVGGACVSEKHAGFVINRSGTATAADVCALVEKIKETVFQTFGVNLHCEIKMLGEF